MEKRYVKEKQWKSCGSFHNLHIAMKTVWLLLCENELILLIENVHWHYNLVGGPGGCSVRWRDDDDDNTHGNISFTIVNCQFAVLK